MLQPLCWHCVECTIHHEQDVYEEQHLYIYVAQTSNNRSWHVISIVTCCLSVKLCALAAQVFLWQQNGAVTRM